MIKDFATITEKTDNTLVLVPDVVKPGYMIDAVCDEGAMVKPKDCNNLGSEGITVMIFYDNWCNTVLGAFNVGDKIGITYKKITN